jgi:hypothetical protein
MKKIIMHNICYNTFISVANFKLYILNNFNNFTAVYEYLNIYFLYDIITMLYNVVDKIH